MIVDRELLANRSRRRAGAYSGCQIDRKDLALASIALPMKDIYSWFPAWFSRSVRGLGLGRMANNSTGRESDVFLSVSRVVSGRVKVTKQIQTVRTLPLGLKCHSAFQLLGKSPGVSLRMKTSTLDSEESP